jgi:alkylation response protein AidB-like acyl-CoA dehydrogenase
MSTIYDDASAWFEANWDPTMSLGDWWARLAGAGYAFPRWPKMAGGRSFNKAESAAITRARRDVGAYGPPNGVATFLVAPTLFQYGTAEQQERYLPAIADGTVRWCQLFSEPGYGSDMAGLATRAELDGDEWTVNGQKVWNSGAHYADFAILIARTDPDQPKHKGITFFLFDMRQPGVEVRPLREMTGDAAFNEVFMTNARVHESDRLGDIGAGWHVAMTTLSHERNPENPGLSETAPFGEVELSMPVGEHAVAEARNVDGFSISLSGGGGALFDRVINETDAWSNPLMRQRLAELASMRRIGRWSNERTAARMKAGAQPGPEVSTQKINGAEMNRRMRDLGLEAMGAEGMLWSDDTPTDGIFHRFAMFTPASSIAGGTDEVMRNVLGERVLGLQREPGESDQREKPWKDLPKG